MQTQVESKKNFERLTGNDNAALTPKGGAAWCADREMDLLTIGTINDMYTEMQNDENQDHTALWHLRMI